MDDQQILQRIREMVDDERALRSGVSAGTISSDEEHQRLRRIEVELDRCWDLLRQRRALRDAGEDVQEAAVRPAGEVEGYQQ